MATVLKATSKGQITLPAKWRKNFMTDQFIATQKGNILEIAPLDLTKLQAKDEHTVFDALRDNNGKGITAKDLAALLQKMK